MAGMGRVPKAGSRHRGSDTLATTLVRLPAEGKKGRPPSWPLSVPSKDESAAWKQLWHTPQAVEWYRLGWTRTVARYARVLIEAEKSGASAALLSEARQMEDRLGLTSMSMLRLRWAIDEVEQDGPAALAVVPDRWRNAAAG